jgi:hypothetical protein
VAGLFAKHCAKISATEGGVRWHDSAKVQPKGPDWSPEQTLRVLRQQLEKLQVFKGKNHREMSNEEDVWKQMTQAALTHGFGEDSDNVGHFHSARWAGTHSMMGIPDYQQPT